MAIIGRTYRHNKTGREVVLIRELHGGREYEVGSNVNRRKDRIRACDIYDRPAGSGWSIVPESEYKRKPMKQLNPSHEWGA